MKTWRAFRVGPVADDVLRVELTPDLVESIAERLSANRAVMNASRRGCGNFELVILGPIYALLEKNNCRSCPECGAVLKQVSRCAARSHRIDRDICVGRVPHNFA